MINPNPNRFLIDFLTLSGTCSEAHRTRIHRTYSPSFLLLSPRIDCKRIQMNAFRSTSWPYARGNDIPHVVTRTNTSFPLDCVRAIKTSIVPLRGDLIFRNLTSSTLYVLYSYTRRLTLSAGRHCFGRNMCMACSNGTMISWDT